jgi:hypothetical protein
MKRFTFLLAVLAFLFGSSAFAGGLLPNVTVGGTDTEVVVVRPNAPDLIVPVTFESTAPAGVYQLSGSWTRSLNSRVQTRTTTTRMKILGGIMVRKEARLRQPGFGWTVVLTLTHDGVPVPITGGAVNTGGRKIRTSVPMLITGGASPPVDPPVNPPVIRSRPAAW